MSITSVYNAHVYDNSGREANVKVVIHHNGDCSGEVVINVPTWVGQPAVHNFTEGGEDHHIAELTIPYSALRDLVLDHLRNEMVGKLENMSNDELLNALVIKP